MDSPWEAAEVGCPACKEMIVLRPGVVEIWCQRCDEGYDLTESRSPREPARTVLILSRQGEPTGRA